MALRSWLVVVVTLMLALACGGDGAEPIDAPSPSPATATDVPLHVAAAYHLDCAAVLPAEFEAGMGDLSGDLQNECTARMMQQNCGSDNHGCWNKGQECRNACGAPCVSCQDSCVPACTSCKAACNGDAECEINCAIARGECRQTCMDARTRCMEETCAQAEKACDAAGEAMVEKTCGPCQTLLVCILAAHEAEDYELKTCKAKNPSTPEECWTWCSPV